ncbi:MAG: translation elongation factor Ts [Thermodesulfobacteriota bacterium]
MSEISAKMVKELRDKTGAPFIDCKNALEDVDGDFGKASEILRIKGVAKASKKVGRATPEGSITSYIHAGGKIGVMVEVNCETDFVARNEEFQKLCKEIAMQIAASNPTYISKEDIPESILLKEKELMRAQVIESGKPEDIANKIVKGKIGKFYEEVCLIDQTYIRNSKVKVIDIIQAVIAKVGENIIVRRFVRYQLGEALEND